MGGQSKRKIGQRDAPVLLHRHLGGIAPRKRSCSSIRGDSRRRALASGRDRLTVQRHREKCWTVTDVMSNREHALPRGGAGLPPLRGATNKAKRKTL
ncbi:hypothetical protein MRX96_025131 [Rhipicephalus microplus]